MRTLLVLLTVALLAGCTDNSSTQSSEDPTENQPGGNETAPEVWTGTGVITGVGSPVVSFSQGGAVDFIVPEGTTVLFAEMKWNSDVMDLDLHLQTGDNLGATSWDHSHTAGQPGSPDNPHFIEVANPPAGDWRATGFANGAAADVTVTYAMTFFMGDVPADYTAF